MEKTSFAFLVALKAARMIDIAFARSVYGLFLITSLFLSSCKSGPFNVFKSASPHEIYKRNLISSGLAETAIGKTWIDLSDRILLKPLPIELPYRERGYFPAEKVQATAFSFKMERGQKLNVKLSKKPLTGFTIYADIWGRDEDGKLNILGSNDSLGTVFQSEIDRTGTYILRLQPELLVGGEYILEITSAPSLAYPLKSYQNNQIQSFFGDGRDANTRKHEGVDIFSAFRTPVLAVASGTARVNENTLGGKVVWLRPDGKDFRLYYAHLDEQLVTDGQTVSIGDTLGLMGNTGNARTTPPHLHFGIYTHDGAVNPLPFINPKIEAVPKIKADAGLLNATVRTIGNASLTDHGSAKALMKNGTIAQVKAVSAHNYKVELPDGTTGYVASGKITEAKSLQKLKLNAGHTYVFDRPDTLAAVKLDLKLGEVVNVLGSFGSYNFIISGDETGWIRK